MESKSNSKSTVIPNLMNLVFDDAWLEEAARLEDTIDCEITAGYSGPHLSQVLANPAGFRNTQRLRSIVLQEFRDLLKPFNLGLGIDAAFTCGKAILIDRLQNPSVSIQEQLWAVLEEDLNLQNTDELRPLRKGIRSIVQGLLTPEDWRSIASSAGNAVRDELIEQIQSVRVA